MILYSPNKLRNTKEKIVCRHLNSREVNFDPKDTGLKAMILRLAALEESDLEREAYILTGNEVKKLAAYIPGNCFDVDISNLFTIYSYRANDALFGILYNNWQNHFNNNNCNAYIYQWILLDEEKIFEKVIGEELKTDFKKIILNGSVDLAFADILREKVANSALSLDEILEPWKLKTSSVLYSTMKRLFYTFCRKRDYLEIDKNELLLLVKEYAYKKDTELKRFVMNFLKALEIRDLDQFKVIGKYVSGLVDLPGTQRYEEFFKDVPRDLVRKYNDWINRITIDEVFGNDERSIFWRDYSFDLVKKYIRSDSVVMYMGEYCATEFLGKANGPIYFFKKDVFQEKVENWFRRYDNREMRSVLYNHQELCIETMTHLKPGGDEFYWYGPARKILYRYNMTRKIDGV